MHTVVNEWIRNDIGTSIYNYWYSDCRLLFSSCSIIVFYFRLKQWLSLFTDRIRGLVLTRSFNDTQNNNNIILLSNYIIVVDGFSNAPNIPSDPKNIIHTNVRFARGVLVKRVGIYCLPPTVWNVVFRWASSNRSFRFQLLSGTRE